MKRKQCSKHHRSKNFQRRSTGSHRHGWWQAEIGALHGLFTLYSHQGRLGQWDERLLSVAPDFVDGHLAPVPGREKWWSFVVDHKLRIAYRRRDLTEAERLARAIIVWERRECEQIKLEDPPRLNPSEKKKLRDLAIATARLADILRDKGNTGCLGLNEEALHIYRAIEDRIGVSIRLHNMGHVFKNVPRLRDLDKAARYYSQAYKSYPEQDRLARAQCLGQLGAVSLERLQEGINTGKSEHDLLIHLNAGIKYYRTALQMEPPDAVPDLARTHGQLGLAYHFSKTEQTRSLHHFEQSVRYFDLSGEWFESAEVRMNAAQVLTSLSRFDEALVYVDEAIGIFESIKNTGTQLAYAKRLASKIRAAIP